MRVFLCCFLLLSFLASSCHAFAAPNTKPPVSLSPLTKQAVEIFNAKYPFNRPPPKKDKFANFGMPNYDIDGTKLSSEREAARTGKRLTDISEAEATASFNELAQLYGEDRAIEMCKTMPIILVFDLKQFAGALEQYASIFGEEKAKDMVLRNPGLLAVKASDAATATDQTMNFSYIVAYTRPVGGLLLGGLFLLLSIPLLEGVTGIRVNPFMPSF
jgi:hypothetical protein